MLELDKEVLTFFRRPLFFPINGINADRLGVELKVLIISWTGIVIELASFVTAISLVTISICGRELIAYIGAYTFVSYIKLPSLVLKPSFNLLVNGLDCNLGSIAMRFCS
jgi:hypothetical protein